MGGHLLAKLIINGTPVPAPTGFVQDGNLGGLTDWTINILGIVAILAALFFLLWGGLKWITSSGDKEKLANARRTVVFAIVGLLVVAFAIVIINLISDLLVGGTSQSKSQSQYHCPEGTYTCGATANTHCPLCSRDKSCNTSDQFTVYECSVEKGKPSGCYGNNDCATNCPAGQTGIATCQGYNYAHPNNPGVCVQKCTETETVH